MKGNIDPRTLVGSVLRDNATGEEYEVLTVEGAEVAPMYAWVRLRNLQNGLIYSNYYANLELEIKHQEETTAGKYLAPNGKPSNLTPELWEYVRTPQFKAWFGNWEKENRIRKLITSKPIFSSGNEYSGNYDLNNKSAEKYIKEFLRKEYINHDTGDSIRITARGAEKVTRHDAENEIHLKSIALIPKMIEESVFIDEEKNDKKKTGYESYRYYVVGMNIDNIDYTAKLVIGKIGKMAFYDHALTEIEKGKLLADIDGIKRSFDSEKPHFGYKDKRLFSILQTNSSKILDNNGEPMVLYHGTDRKFDEFISTKRGIWFADSDSRAKGYAAAKGGDIVIPVFLNIRKPAYSEYPNSEKDDWRRFSELGYDGRIVDDNGHIFNAVALGDSQVLRVEKVLKEIRKEKDALATAIKERITDSSAREFTPRQKGLIVSYLKDHVDEGIEGMEMIYETACKDDAVKACCKEWKEQAWEDIVEIYGHPEKFEEILAEASKDAGYKGPKY